MSNLNIYITIILMSIFTYSTRIIPLILLGHKKLSARTVQFLSFIPISVMGSLLTYELFFKKVAGDDILFLSMDNYILIAGILTFILGYIIRNFFATIIAGMIIISMLRYLF